MPHGSGLRAGQTRPFPHGCHGAQPWDLGTDYNVLVTLHRLTLATSEQFHQLHQLHCSTAGIKQTHKRLPRLQAEGLARS
ncbi:hypothetical protein P3T35_007325 [Kitasatospora sp. GP30]|nr:hypothetical protein [Kitasatospora sp. GP30]